MKFDASVGSFLLALVGALSGWIAWWLKTREQATQKAVVAAEKALNDKRDFNHLVNNQLDISRNMAHCFESVEHQLTDIDNEVREIKAYLIRYQNNHMD